MTRSPDRSGHFASALSSLLAEGAPETGHVDVDTLAAYGEGGLKEAEEARVREHLVRCRPCAQLLLDLEEFRQPADPPEGAVADLSDAAALRAMRARLREEDGAPADRRGGWPRWSAALAAGLLLAVVGLSFRVAQLGGAADDLRRQLGAASRPQVNVPIAYLDPPARNDSAVVTVEAPAGGHFVLLATPEAQEPLELYEVEIMDAGGDPVWRASGFEVSEHGTLRLLLSTEAVPAGDYRVRIRGIAGDRRAPAGDYSLRVVTRGS